MLMRTVAVELAPHKITVNNARRSAMLHASVMPMFQANP